MILISIQFQVKIITQHFNELNALKHITDKHIHISIVVYWSVFFTGNNNHCHNSALFLFCNYTTDISLCH